MQDNNSSKIKRVGILTSGGDSPGMNSVISAVYKTFRGMNYEKDKDSSINHNSDKRQLELVLIKNGYQGLLDNEICEINSAWAKLIDLGVGMGGTIIGSSRCKDFESEEGRKKAFKILQDQKIETIIAIGGDGTFAGLQKLSELGIQCIGCPGTIDNDIAATEFTIGFDTALNTIIESIDKIRQTANSHSRIQIVEVMGRHCGDLAIHAAAATNAELVSTPELKIEEPELVETLKELVNKQKRSSIIIVVTELLYDIQKLAKKIEEATKKETRATNLGQVQRGGTPSAFDRYLATMIGIFAAEQLQKSTKDNWCIVLKENKLVAVEIQDIVTSQKDPKDPKKNLIRINAINKTLRLSGIIPKKLEKK